MVAIAETAPSVFGHMPGPCVPPATLAVPPDPETLPQPTQAPLDCVDEASMDSFPCSDPPGYTMSHS